ncbi:MAG: hypothetical protein ABFD91_10690 [Anaerohalosphaeraceae bacterium]
MQTVELSAFQKPLNTPATHPQDAPGLAPVKAVQWPMIMPSAKPGPSCMCLRCLEPQRGAGTLKDIP